MTVYATGPRSGSRLFASILKFVSNVRQIFAADDFNRRHFSDVFFLGAILKISADDNNHVKLPRIKRVKLECTLNMVHNVQ